MGNVKGPDHQPSPLVYVRVSCNTHVLMLSPGKYVRPRYFTFAVGVTYMQGDPFQNACWRGHFRSHWLHSRNCLFTYSPMCICCRPERYLISFLCHWRRFLRLKAIEKIKTGEGRRIPTDKAPRNSVSGVCIMVLQRFRSYLIYRKFPW